MSSAFPLQGRRTSGDALKRENVSSINLSLVIPFFLCSCPKQKFPLPLPRAKLVCHLYRKTRLLLLVGKYFTTQLYRDVGVESGVGLDSKEKSSEVKREGLRQVAWALFRGYTKRGVCENNL